MKFTIKDTLKIVLILSCVSTTQIKPADSQALFGPGRALLATRANQVDQATQTDEEDLDTSFECDICLMPIVANGEDDEKPEATPCQHLFHKGCLDRSKEAQLEARASVSCPTCRGLLNILPGQDPHNARRREEAVQEVREEHAMADLQTQMEQLKICLKATALVTGVLVLTRATSDTCTVFQEVGLVGFETTRSLSDIQPTRFDNVSKTIVLPICSAVVLGSMLANTINGRL